MENNNHIWQFSRVGGVNRVNLETGADLISLEYLDQKLWAALSCPVHGLEIDSKTLEYIDTDKDDRLRVPEILEAVKWITSVLKNPQDLISCGKSLSLSAINEDNAEGKILLASARQILRNLGKTGEQLISVDDTSDTIKIFAETKFNGDGIITEDTAEDEEIKKLINDIISCVGSLTDRSGKQGVSGELVDLFYQNCQDFADWQTKAEDEPAKIFPFGDLTEEAYLVFSSLKLKIEDYFIRCRLAAFDPKSVDVLNNAVSRFEVLSSRDLNASMEEIAALPIALIEASKPLPLNDRINPAWQKKISELKDIILSQHKLNKESISEAEWIELSGKLEAYSQWLSEKNGVLVEKLGIVAVREILTSDKKEMLFTLIEKDKALESEASTIFLVDKMVRYYRDLYTLLNNFITFHDFFSTDSKAIFQIGRLFIDQRSCDLCIKVTDMPKHSVMAGLSGICLIYCDCYSKTKNEKMTIVAALTDGDINNIIVGRNAIFYDNNGMDWDATIVKVIENPISIRQAFWTPYRRFSKFISSQIEKIASSKDKEVHERTTTDIAKTTEKVDAHLTKAVSSTSATVPAQVPLAPAQPFDIGKFVGIFAAIGLALGAIGSVLAAVFAGFFSLIWWKMPFAVLGLILAISGPSMILAWLKLRKRNLAPVLDANGWAINARATINIAFGATLTHVASLPKNSKLNLIDPFSKKKKPVWSFILVGLVVLGVAFYLLWHYGFLKVFGL